MQERYVLAKGRNGGMGARINLLLGAWAYAERTERTLVVDWSDGYYGNDIDTFQAFFENPFLRFSRFREIVSIANKPKSTPPPPEFSRQAGKRNLPRSADQNTWTSYTTVFHRNMRCRRTSSSLASAIPINSLWMSVQLLAVGCALLSAYRQE